jgi:hypothetical protein
MKPNTDSHSKSPLLPIIRALGANLGIAIAKTITAVMTGSGAMMAESIHSYADCANQILLLIGLKESKAPETEEHPLGHGRVMYFYSLLVGMMLLLVGGAFSIYKGVEHFINPEHLNSSDIAYKAMIGVYSQGSGIHPVGTGPGVPVFTYYMDGYVVRCTGEGMIGDCKALENALFPPNGSYEKIKAIIMKGNNGAFKKIASKPTGNKITGKTFK